MNLNHNIRQLTEKIGQNDNNLNNTLLSSLNKLISNSFEVQFVNYEAFETLCLLVCCYDQKILSEELIINIISNMEISEETFLNTIKDIFNMHDVEIPDSIEEVIKKLSNILKN